MPALGLSATAWLHEPAVRVPWQDMVALSCLRRDSEEDADLPCARGSCLASRVASCSCELLTDGRWGQSWLEEWRQGRRGRSLKDGQTDRRASHLPFLQQRTCPGP